MDIALELLDTFAFDYIYSTLLPAQPVPYGLKDRMGNGTTLDARSASSWQFEPASKMISFQPRDAAYMSQWNRDNIYRQTVSLFCITW
jgi:lathosterol oxidase